MKTPPQEDSGRRYRVAPYLWLTSVSGTDLELIPVLLQGASRSFSRTWIGPVIGFRHRAHLTDWLFVIGRGDIGGFGANSELTWQVFSGVRAQIRRWVGAHSRISGDWLRIQQSWFSV